MTITKVNTTFAYRVTRVKHASELNTIDVLSTRIFVLERPILLLLAPLLKLLLLLLLFVSLSLRSLFLFGEFRLATIFFTHSFGQR